MTIQEIFQWAATAGPASIFAVMWFLERQERIRVQKLYETSLERTILGLSSAATAIGENTKAILLFDRGHRE